ncbi:MAG: carboxypeptidase regulatory-like domain-containing protein [Actinomycetota bacterium]|nr:MAG: carboxypeptidase regulatory-like domain-containing protein [Actinomycetota bacterium]
MRSRSAQFGRMSVVAAVVIAVITAMLGSTAPAWAAGSGSISGTVLDSTGDPLEGIAVVAVRVDDDEAEAAAVSELASSVGTEGAAVSALDDDEPIAESDSAGAFTIGGLSAGSYLVAYVDPAGNLATAWYVTGSPYGTVAPRWASVVTSTGNALTLQPVRLSPGAAVAGHISGDAASGGRALAGAHAYAFTNAGDLISAVETDDDGNYLLSGLPARNVLVCADGPQAYWAPVCVGGSPTPFGAAETGVTAGSVTSGVDFVLHYGVRVAFYSTSVSASGVAYFVVGVSLDSRVKAEGQVILRDGTEVFAVLDLRNGQVQQDIRLPHGGSRSITASYSPAPGIEIGRADVQLTVPHVTTMQTRSSWVALAGGNNRVRYDVRVESPGGIPTGNVTLSVGTGQIATVPLVNGVASVVAGRYLSHVSVAYAGSPTMQPSSSLLPGPDLARTTTTLTKKGKAKPGRTVTLVAAVGSAESVPLGVVRFLVGNKVVAVSNVKHGVAKAKLVLPSGRAIPKGGRLEVRASYSSGPARYQGSNARLVIQIR